MILALVVVLFAVLIAGVFGRQAVLGKSMAAKERQLSQAYYVAESGLTEFVQNPDPYVTLPFQPNYGPYTVTAQGGEGLQFVLEITRVRSNVYEVRSMGSTPYATALASIEVTLDDAEGPTLETAYHMGGVGVPLTVPGTPGGGEGNPSGVNYHFSDSDMAVYGVLDFARDEDTGDILQTEQTFNIWGEGLSGQAVFETWNHLIDPPSDQPVMPDWLDPDKLDDLPSNAQFPAFVADYLRAAALSKVPYADFQVQEGNDIDVGINGNSDRIVIDDRTAGIVVSGHGYLRIDNTQLLTISKLTMDGDLTIVSKDDVKIAGINNGWNTKLHNTNGYKLNIISDGSIRLGGASSTYDPYPFFASDHELFFLGSGSILWAQGSLEITGQIRSGEPNDPAYADQPADFDPDDEASRIIVWDDEAVGGGIMPPPTDWPAGSLVLVSKGTGTAGESSLTLHTFDSAGIVYAGDRIKAYRIRLNGPGFFTNPYQMRTVQGQQVVGLAQLNLIASGQNIFDDIDLDDIYVSVIRRLK